MADPLPPAPASGPPSQQLLLLCKVAIVFVIVVGGLVLVALGKIGASEMFGAVGTVAASLVVALGISGAGSAVAQGQQNASITTMRMMSSRWGPEMSAIDPVRTAHVAPESPSKFPPAMTAAIEARARADELLTRPRSVPPPPRDERVKGT